MSAPVTLAGLAERQKAQARAEEVARLETIRTDGGGVKHDAGKPAWNLLPFDALNDVAAVLEYGRNKYASRNWEKGMAWGRLLGAALRHLSAWAQGTERDAESGLPHLAHAACCVLMLLALTKRGVGADDRAVTP